MSAMDELTEDVEHHATNGFDRRVAVTMAIIAAALAIVSVLGHLAVTEELLNQQRASDQWSFYQAKSMRRYTAEVARDLAGTLKSGQLVEKYAADAGRYEKEGEEIQQKAKEFQIESDREGRRAVRLHLGEVFLEIAIVFASLAILTKHSALWGTAIVSAIVGVAVAATAMFIK